MSPIGKAVFQNSGRKGQSTVWMLAFAMFVPGTPGFGSRQQRPTQKGACGNGNRSNYKSLDGFCFTKKNSCGTSVRLESGNLGTSLSKPHQRSGPPDLHLRNKITVPLAEPGEAKELQPNAYSFCLLSMTGVPIEILFNEQILMSKSV